MLTVKQWVLLALCTGVVVSFCTHELLRVELPGDARHETWAKFVRVHLNAGVGSDTGVTWAVLMLLQTVQIVLGVPFLHVTQVCMGLLLPVVPATLSCIAVEICAVVFYMQAASRSVSPPDMQTLRHAAMLTRTRAESLAFTGVLLMSSIPLYVSVLVVHLRIVSQRDFWYLACGASVLSVAKNIALGMVLRSDQNEMLALVLGGVVFFMPIVCTIVVTGGAFMRQGATHRTDCEQELPEHCTDYADEGLEEALSPGPGSPSAARRMEKILSHGEDAAEDAGEDRLEDAVDAASPGPPQSERPASDAGTPRE